MSKLKNISLKDFESKLIKDLKDPFKQNKAFEILLDKYKEKVYFQNITFLFELLKICVSK